MAEAPENPSSSSSPLTDDGAQGVVVTQDSCSSELDQVYAQLAQKEQDLMLAAELGKALLDSNHDLQSRYDQMVDTCNKKIEVLEQEKYDLHLELEKIETEFQNTIKDLQEDVTALRKQARDADQMENSEKEQLRNLREAQQMSDYLSEQVKQATLREEEMEKELAQLRLQNESQTATVQDQTDHITMLREQVEYLSEKLRDTNQRLLEIQGERESIASTLEAAQEKLQDLENQASHREKEIQRQSSEIVELQESYCELQQQLHQRRQALHHPSHPHFSSATSTPVANPMGFKPTIQRSTSTPTGTSQKSLVADLSDGEFHIISPGAVECQEVPISEEVSLRSRSSSISEDSLDGSVVPLTVETSLLEEFSTLAPSQTSDRVGYCQTGSSLEQPHLASRHRRNISDGSISSLTEGSRKRHHENVSGNANGEDDESHKNGRGTKQTLYSKSVSKNHLSSFGKDSSLNKVPSQKRGNSHLTTLATDSSNISFDSDQSISTTQAYDDAADASGQVLAEAELNSNPTSVTSGRRDTILPEYLYSKQLELACDINNSYDSQASNSSDPPTIDASCGQGQSLFSELSSQLMEDNKARSQSVESASSCMMGAFDFSSGIGSQESGLVSSQDLPSESQGGSTRPDSDGYGTDWHNMTSDMLEEDDFECDDDDFLMGNLAGTTLSISNSRQGPLLFPYSQYYEEDGTEEDALTNSQNTGLYSDATDSNDAINCQDTDSQEKITQACSELRDLVLRVQGQSKAKATESGAATVDDLLHLVHQMRVCVDRLTTSAQDREDMPPKGSCGHTAAAETWQSVHTTPSMSHSPPLDIKKSEPSYELIRRSL